MTENQDRGAWSSRIGFIMAGAGSAVGLGNIWRFPYITGENGGAAFVMIYIMCIFLIGFPVMIAELTLGRKTAKNPVGMFHALAPGSPWKYVGGLSVITGLVIFSWYSVIAGWVVGYLYKTAAGHFNNLTDPSATETIFRDFVSNPFSVILLTAFFIALTGYVVFKGVKSGIEKWSRVLMPILVVLLILLAIRSVTLPGASEGLIFYLKPDFSAINTNMLIAALGQAFFSLSLGMGTMITYGSYLSKKDNIPTAAAWVCTFDTLIAILAGFVILPAVAAMGKAYTEGPGLIFQVLPSLFGEMPGGQIFGVGFFMLIIIAAITSTVSILIVPVAYMVDEKKWSRRNAVGFMCLIAFVLSVPAALANGAVGFLSSLPGLGTDFFTIISSLFGDVSLTLGSLLIALFVGWKWSTAKAKEEIESEGITFGLAKQWSFLIRFVAPITVSILLGYTFRDNIWKLFFG